MRIKKFKYSGKRRDVLRHKAVVIQLVRIVPHKNAALKICAVEPPVMFGAVQSIGGRTPCQDDHRTFRIMRRSQLSAWSTETPESCRSDLRAAALHGINLLERKYACMMRDSDPAYYEKHLASRLPAVTSDREALVRRIASICGALAILDSTLVFFPILCSSLLFHQETLTLKKLLGCALGFCGILVMNLSGGAGSGLRSGVLWSLLLKDDPVSSVNICLFTNPLFGILCSALVRQVRPFARRRCCHRCWSAAA